MLVDTHCHLTMTATHKNNLPHDIIAQEITKIYEESKTSHVTKIIDVGTTARESMSCVELALSHENIYAAIGIHPCDVTPQWRDDIKILERLCTQTPQGNIVAIGECGIDLYHQPADLSQQQDLFYAQIELALTHQLALVVHSRNAPEETLACLERYRNSGLRGVMHCFSYDTAIAYDVIAHGFLLGIGGTITYPKNQIFRDLIQRISLDYIVLETDAPFLPPQPWRGKSNHPQYIRYIAEYIAQQRNETFEHVAQKTTYNATQLFHLR